MKSRILLDTLLLLVILLIIPLLIFVFSNFLYDSYYEVNFILHDENIFKETSSVKRKNFYVKVCDSKDNRIH